MVISDLVGQLRDEGLRLSRFNIYLWIEHGYVSLPELDGSGRFKFTQKHAKEIRSVLANPPRRGRPKLEPAK